MSVDYDVVILNSALWKFNQTLLLEAVYKKLKAKGKQTLIICVGSTTDRVMKATDIDFSSEFMKNNSLTKDDFIKKIELKNYNYLTVA